MLEARLKNAARRALEQRQAKVALLAGRLQEMSPLTVLSRGYAIALGPGGRALRHAVEAPVGSVVKLRLHDGVLRARVEGGEP